MTSSSTDPRAAWDVARTVKYWPIPLSCTKILSDSSSNITVGTVNHSCSQRTISDRRTSYFEPYNIMYICTIFYGTYVTVTRAIILRTRWHSV
jgi:hypothetical protein